MSFPAVGIASGGVFWLWRVFGGGALAVWRPVPCAGANDRAALRVAGTHPAARAAKRGVFPVGECASVVVAKPGLARDLLVFSVRRPWLAVAAPDQASVFGQGSSCQLGERIVFRPWRFRLAVERVRRPTPRAADPPAAEGKRRGICKLWL